MNKTILFAFVAALLATQACSKSHRETSEHKDRGPLANDPNTEIRSKDQKFLCDFQWTPGYKYWNYDSDGDKSVGKLDSDKDPWCLIPYEEFTEYGISIKGSVEGYDKPVHYFCRNANSAYAIANEFGIVISNNSYYRGEMKCAKLNSDSAIAITAKTADAPYKDEKLYHVVLEEDDEQYTITGHLNLRLVKPVYLSVLWEPIWNTGAITGFMTAKLDVAKIKEDWKRYMKMAGYYIDIKTVPIAFPNILEKLPGNVDDGALTLPQEKDILELPDKMVGWYNESVKVINGIGDFFGADVDLPKLKETNYTIAVTPGYKIRYGMEKILYSETTDTIVTKDPSTGEETKTVFVTSKSCMVGFTYNQMMDIVKNIGNMPNAPMVTYYSKTSIPLGSGFPGLSVLNISEQDCNNVSYASGENYGTKPQVFGIKKGYVLSDIDFFKSKNAGRLLAALLYSKIRGTEYPIKNNDNGRWLSSYYNSPDVEQPKKDWRKENSGNQQQNVPQELLEFASAMQYFNFKGE
jgi:hypothetical protein